MAYTIGRTVEGAGCQVTWGTYSISSLWHNSCFAWIFIVKYLKTILFKPMVTSSNGNISALLLALWKGNPTVTGGFSSLRPVTRSFDIFFNLRFNKWLDKQSRRRWFETPSRSLWRHSNVSCLWPHLPQVSNIRRTLVGNKIVDHSDVVGVSPVGAASTTSSFSTWHPASLD